MADKMSPVIHILENPQPVAMIKTPQLYVQLFGKECQITVRELAEEMNIKYGSVQSIDTEDLGYEFYVCLWDWRKYEWVDAMWKHCWQFRKNIAHHQYGPSDNKQRVYRDMLQSLQESFCCQQIACVW